MNERKKAANPILWQIAVEAKPPDQINLWPSIKAQLRTSNITFRQQETPMNAHIQKPLFMRLVVLTLLFVTAIGLIAMTPPGQALAQQVLKFFQPAPQLSYPVPAVDQQQTIESTPTQITALACPQSEIVEKYACDLTYAEKQLGFPIKALPILPDLPYSGLDIDIDRGIVHLYYGPEATLWIVQGKGDYPQSIGSVDDHWNEVPENAVQVVTVNGQPAEYVEGGFAQLPDSSNKYTWLSELPMARLRWKDGDYWYQITRPGTPELLKNLLGSRDALIKLGERLLWAEHAIK
jgi:hypothetical protein